MSDSYSSEGSYTWGSEVFTEHQQYVLRVLSVVSSCISIPTGLVAFYLYISMRVKVFRHHLILELLLFDFGKAVILLWYPARVLLVPSAYDNINFCDVAGFLTSVFIEGADLAVLALAIHTALVVFMKKNTSNGLYPYRYFVYGLNICIPLLFASLAFVGKGRYSYEPMITWCYLPYQPAWYRLVLSWVPRYIILVSIVTIYVSIYIYVKLQYRAVVKNFKLSQTMLDSDDEQKSNKNILKRAWASFLYFLSYLPGFAWAEPKDVHDPNAAAAADLEAANMDPRAYAVKEFQRESLQKFQMRRNTIERQIKSIFIYPVAYVFLWMFPFVLQILHFKFSYEDNGSLYWVSAAAAFMQPFNCTVDSIAFCIRETPWRDRKERIFTTKAGIYLWIKQRIFLIKDYIFTSSNNTRNSQHNCGTSSSSESPPLSPTSKNQGSQDDSRTMVLYDGEYIKSPTSVAHRERQASTVTASSMNNNGTQNSYNSDRARRDKLDPLSTAGRRIDLEDDDDDDDTEMDLIDFLR